MDPNEFRELLTRLPSYAALNTCMVLGNQTGLFSALCEQTEPISVSDLANKCTLKDRILGEWIDIFVNAKVLSVEEKTGRYFIREAIKDVLKEDHTSLMFVLGECMLTLGARQKKFREFFKSDGPKGLPMAETPEIFDALNIDPVANFRNIFENTLFKRVDGLKEKLESGVDFFEVGCGRGAILRILAKCFPKGRYLGVDSANSLIENANTELKDSGLKNCTFDVQDALHLPEQWAGQFDVVYMDDVLHDLSHPQAAAKELFRVLRKNGVALFSDVNMKPDSDLAVTQSPFFIATNMFYCLPGDMGKDGANPIGCVRTGDALEETLKSVFSSVEVLRVSDMHILHVCSI